MSPKFSLLLLLGLVNSTSAQDLDYYQDIYPFLKSNCISCHNKTTTKGDLDMETPESMKKGGSNGPAILPGKGAESLVVLASRHQEDMEMPPANNKSGAINLDEAEIALLTRWIDEGAKSSIQQQRVVAWQALAASVQPIYSIALSPDGRYAACGRSNKIFIYDLATRQFVAHISDPALKNQGAHRSIVQSLAFSPDGQYLASGSFREVKLWKRSSPAAQEIASVPVDAALLQKIQASAKVKILSHSISSDGKLAVIATDNGQVRIWDVATAKFTQDLKYNFESLQKQIAKESEIAKFTLDIAFYKESVTKIETQNKALEELLKKANEAIVAMKKVLPEKQKALEPENTAKAAVQKEVDDLTKALGDSTDAAKVAALKAAQDKLLTASTKVISAQAAVAAAESNIRDAEDDQKRIAETKSKNAILTEQSKKASSLAEANLAKAKSELAALKSEASKTAPTSVAISPDTQFAIAKYAGAPDRIWAITSGQAVASASTPVWKFERLMGGDNSELSDRINALDFSPDGKTLATGGGETSRSGDLILFDVASGKATHTYKDLHEDSILGLEYSPDGKSIATGGADKIAKVIEAVSGRQLNSFESHTNYVNSVSFRADGRVLATGGADSMVLTWDMASGERKSKIAGWVKEVTSVNYIGSTNQLVTSAGENLVRVVTDTGGQVRSITNLPDFMQNAKPTITGQLFVGGGEDSVLRIWDASGKELASFGPPTL